jgi:DNA-binding NarL/FixJ family response regulator
MIGQRDLKQAASVALPKATRLRVLLIDDHGEVAHAIRPILEGNGVEVTGVATNDGHGLPPTGELPDVLLVCVRVGSMLVQPPALSPPKLPASREAAVWLTLRERQVLALLADGASNKSMAKRLSLSPNTVRTHVQNILGKLGVHSRLEAVTLAIRQGLVKPQDSIATMSWGEVVRPRFGT